MQRSVVLAVISVAIIVLISVGVIGLQRSLDPFSSVQTGITGIEQQPSTAAGNRTIVSLTTVRLPTTVYSTQVTTTLSLTTKEIVNTQYTTSISLEETTINGATTQVSTTTV